MNWLSIFSFATLSLLIAAQRQLQVDETELEIPDSTQRPDKVIPAMTTAIHVPSALDDCDSEMIGFELITGFVFSAPGNALETIPALMLTDCLETCQGNDSCKSVNYETGLCILFSSNADALPGKSIRKRSVSKTLTLVYLHLHLHITNFYCAILKL